MPPTALLQQINKATGYTPDMGKTGGAVYARPSYPVPTYSAGAAYTSPSNSPSSRVAPDPYAAWGGQANYSRLVSGFNDQKQNVINAESAAGTTAHRDIGGSILDLIDQLTTGQNKINNDATQNYLAKQQGTAGVLSMVQHGLQSGAVQLANKNATNSSASEALARAYGDIGRRAQSQVGNQFAQGQNTVSQEQQQQEVTKAAGVRHVQQTKADAIDNIVQDATQRLAAIDSAMLGANLPTRLNLEAEKQNIRNTAVGQLSDLDAQLSQGVGGIQPKDETSLRTAASQLATAGTAAAQPFQYTTAGPAQFQNTGPFASSLPLFTLGAKKQNS